jgi:hypothetical protein
VRYFAVPLAVPPQKNEPPKPFVGSGKASTQRGNAIAATIKVNLDEDHASIAVHIVEYCVCWSSLLAHDAQVGKSFRSEFADWACGFEQACSPYCSHLCSENWGFDKEFKLHPCGGKKRQMWQAESRRYRNVEGFRARHIR